ncbi:MAG: SCP2 sterol-binding domain-containing protein [Acidimicrobiia bacterium]|nr:SCP2 sterol-binding domain-containing protein [Acidimicrobiia bacterium]MBJ7381055.1 SCP2 sterol-binding domain-containing protein [Acidimicrobiia bacterium]
MSKYPFLSDDWFAAVAVLIQDHGDDAPAHANMVMNLTVTDTPFGAERQLHMGASDGKGRVGIGHDDAGEITITTDYDTAKQIFISGDPQAGMQAMMSGKLKIQGDMSKLMSMAQQGGAPAGGPALAEAIQGITE